MRYLLLALLVAAPVHAANWRAATKADHESLDVIQQRLERVRDALPEGSAERLDVEACLHHVNPMLVRHGGHTAKIPPGSEEELALVCAHNGYAHTFVEHEPLWMTLTLGPWRWLWRTLVAGLWVALPWVVIAGLLWFGRRRLLRLLKDRDAEQVATYKRVAEVVPEPVRKGTLASDTLVARGYRRLHAEGKV